MTLKKFRIEISFKRIEINFKAKKIMDRLDEQGTNQVWNKISNNNLQLANDPIASTNDSGLQNDSLKEDPEKIIIESSDKSKKDSFFN